MGTSSSLAKYSKWARRNQRGRVNHRPLLTTKSLTTYVLLFATWYVVLTTHDLYPDSLQYEYVNTDCLPLTTYYFLLTTHYLLATNYSLLSLAVEDERPQHANSSWQDTTHAGGRVQEG